MEFVEVELPDVVGVGVIRVWVAFTTVGRRVVKVTSPPSERVVDVTSTKFVVRETVTEAEVELG